MQLRNIALLAIVTPLWIACAAPPFASERALTVQVQRQFSTILDKCKRLDPVTVRVATGPTGWVHNPIEIAAIAAENQAREQVAAAGGDVIVFTTLDRLQGNPTSRLVTGVQVQGVGFRCKG